MIKAIIFDFDGVLADTLQIGFESNNCLFEKHGTHPCPSLNEFKSEMNKFKSYEGFLLTHGIDREKMELKEGDFHHDYVLANIHRIKPNEKLRETIKQLSQKYKLSVVSSSWKAIIEKVLESHNLLHYFDHVIGVDAAGSKAERIHKSLNLLNTKPEEAFYIGDMTYDIDEGKKAGVKTIILANDSSWNHKEDLIKHNPEILIEHPEQLLEVLENE